jgi:hypothetical protein
MVLVKTKKGKHNIQAMANIGKPQYWKEVLSMARERLIMTKLRETPSRSFLHRHNSSLPPPQPYTPAQLFSLILYLLPTSLFHHNKNNEDAKGDENRNKNENMNWNSETTSDEGRIQLNILITNPIKLRLDLSVPSP